MKRFILQVVHSDRKYKFDKNSSDRKQSKSKKNWPSIQSLARHANFRPLGEFFFYFDHFWTVHCPLKTFTVVERVTSFQFWIVLNSQLIGVTDDWGPLTHKHELMPMDNVRYWHQHRCEVCDKLFEHKHKQRGDQSMNYNRHVCNVCGGTNGSRRVLFKNSQPFMGYGNHR